MDLSDIKSEIIDRPGLDDPIWIYLVQSRLQVYIPHVRTWWQNIAELVPVSTGIYAIPDSPPGLMYRFTRTAIRSPIHGIQAFPFVPTGYLQLTNIQGGSTKLIERVCKDYMFTIDEFTIVAKSNLPATYNQGQIVAFVPTELLLDTQLLGAWIYLTREEITALMDILALTPLQAIRNKLILRV